MKAILGRFSLLRWLLCMVDVLLVTDKPQTVPPQSDLKVQMNKIKLRSWLPLLLSLLATEVASAAAPRHELARFGDELTCSSPLYPGLPLLPPLLIPAPIAILYLGFQPSLPLIPLPPSGRPLSSSLEPDRRALSFMSCFALTWPVAVLLGSHHPMADTVRVRGGSAPTTVGSTPCSQLPPLPYHPSSKFGPTHPLPHHPRPTPLLVSPSKKTEPCRHPLEPRRHSLWSFGERFPHHSCLSYKGRPWLRRGRPPRQAGFGWRGHPWRCRG